MVQLNTGRNTPERLGGDRVAKLAANQTVHAGAILMRNAAGLLLRGALAVGSVGVGRAEASQVSTASGVIDQSYRPGTFRYVNSAAADAITIADIGTACYIVDDQTVARTSATNTRSPAGIVEDVDAQGVWVRFDETMTRALLS